MYKQLISEQRYAIYLLLRKGYKKNEIALSLGVHPSTIGRELKRNSGNRNKYNWQTAQANASRNRHRTPGNRTINDSVRQEAVRLVQEDWSPEQISGTLLKEGVRISYETIYKIIRTDKRRGGTLYRHCRHRLRHRKRPVGQRRGHIPERTGIELRPKEADGSRFGDWEMDTIVGKNNTGAIVTLIERKTNFLLMRKLPHGKNAEETADTVVKLLEPFKSSVKSITTDNGTEFTNHKDIEKKLNVTVYFANPHAPWQKGAVENENGLIRQYIPKGTKFENLSHQKIARIQYKINSRPRKKINFKTPLEAFYEFLP